MKLATNNQVIRPNTINGVNVRTFDDGAANFAGAIGKIRAAGAVDAGRAAANIGRMQGQALNNVAATIQHVGEQIDSVNVQAASNEYTKRLNELLYNQENGLMNTKMQQADGITQRFEEEERKIRQEVGGQYKFLSQKGAMTFQNMTNNSASQRFEMVRRHQTQQFNAYQDQTFNNAIDLNTQTAADNYTMADVVQQNMAEAIATTRMRLAGQGEEVLKAAERKVIGSIAQQVIGRAYANGDDDMAGVYIERYGKFMDPAQITQYSKAVHQRVVSNMIRNTSDSLVARYGNNLAALYDAIYNRGEGGTGYNGDAAVAWMEKQAKDGANWGVNTCTRGVNGAIEAGGALPGNLWAPTNWDEAKKSGIAFTDKRLLQSGDIVYWWKPGSDKDADDTSHVGIYDAKTGKVYQSGTSGFRPIDLDAYSITGFARPRGQGMTMEQKDQLYNSCVRQINQQKAIRNAQNDRVYDALDQQLMGLHDAGNMDYGTYMAMVDQVAGSDPEMRRKGRACAEYWYNATVKGANPKATGNRTTRNVRGAADMDTITCMIRDTEFDSVSDMVAFMQSAEPPFSAEQVSKAKQLWQQKLSGEGIFKYPDIDKYISAAVAGEKDMQAKKSREIVLRQYAINYINSYREKYHKDPSIEDLETALSKEYTDKKFVYRNQDVSFEYDPIMLTRKGIVSADIAYDAEGKETGMMRVVYTDANNQGRSRVTYVPVRQFAEMLGQRQAGSAWTGGLGGNSEADTLNSGT